MKRSYLFVMIIAFMIASTSCSRRVVIVKSPSANGLPPGQAKKITGSKSAKPYAPGQQKKRG